MFQINEGHVVLIVLLIGAVYKVVYLVNIINDANAWDITNIIIDIIVLCSGMRFVWVSYHKSISEKLDKNNDILEKNTKALSDMSKAISDQTKAISDMSKELSKAISDMSKEISKAISDMSKNNEMGKIINTIESLSNKVETLSNTLGNKVESLGDRVRTELRTNKQS